MAEVFPQEKRQAVQPTVVEGTVVSAQPIPVAVPIVFGEAFNTIVEVNTPVVFGKVITPKTVGVLAATNVFTVRQHMKLRELMTGGCIVQPNTYTVYAGTTTFGDNDHTAELFRVQEISDNCSRCCCAPCHPLKLEVKGWQGRPRPAGSSNEGNDLNMEAFIFPCCTCRKFDRAKFRDQYYADIEKYRSTPVMMTAIRNGYRWTLCQCCAACSGGDGINDHIPVGSSYSIPDKYVGCGACQTCCLDEMTLVQGATAEENRLMIGGVPTGVPEENIIGITKQPLLGGGCTPTVDVDVGDPNLGMKNVASQYKITGPMCFGGCSELCCDSLFTTRARAINGPHGQVAIITKKRPRNLKGAVREFFSDADLYTLEFTDPTIGAEEKATILSSLLLLDYMFFEKNNDMIECRDNALHINLANCFCFGCVCPCKIVLKGEG